jgi:RND family efflux transporter MFP subunit
MENKDIAKLKIDKTEFAYRPRRRKKFVYLFFLICALLAGAYFYQHGYFTPAVEVQAVNASMMYPSQSFTLLNASGYVVAQRKAAVASKVTGRLVSLEVEEGSQVKEGEIIATLENEDVNASMKHAEANISVARHNLKQAEAELENAQLAFNRNKGLHEKGFVPRSVYDESEARYKRAVASVDSYKASIEANIAALESAKVAVEYTLIRAPFDAVVLTKNADIGDIVAPVSAAESAKAAVVTIADMESLQVEADVSESNLHIVKIGQPCEIQLDAIPETFYRGLVSMIVPTADRSKGAVMIKIKFVDKDSRILPEMSAKVAFLSREMILSEQTPRLVVNHNALLSHGAQAKVFLFQDGKAVEKRVTLGQTFGDRVEVLSGLKVGDRIIVKPLDKIQHGTKVKTVEEK